MRKILEPLLGCLGVIVVVALLFFNEIRKSKILIYGEPVCFKVLSMGNNPDVVVGEGIELEWTGNFDHYGTNRHEIFVYTNRPAVGEVIYGRKNQLHWSDLYADVRVPFHEIRKRME